MYTNAPGEILRTFSLSGLGEKHLAGNGMWQEGSWGRFIAGPASAQGELATLLQPNQTKRSGTGWAAVRGNARQSLIIQDRGVPLGMGFAGFRFL